MNHWLARYAEPAARDRIMALERELAIARNALAVCEAERDLLAAVAARNLARVEAEGAAAARERAIAEGVPNNERTYPRAG